MDNQGAKAIVSTLKEYSVQAKSVLDFLYQYDYREEANEWYAHQDPKLLEPEHPTLRGLYHTLARLIGPIPGRNDNLSDGITLSRENIQAFLNYLEVSQDIPLALTFNRIKIEPLKEVAEKFNELNLKNEARRLSNIFNFAYGIRKWAQESKNNSGAPILINIELNYDEATPEDLSKDAGYKMFSDLFKKTCNYSSKEKRRLYSALQNLYSTMDEKSADKVAMAVILIFRSNSLYKKYLKYKTPFDGLALLTCKRNMMASLGRDIKGIKSYSGNSLFSKPKIDELHVQRAETLIAEALDSVRKSF